MKWIKYIAYTTVPLLFLQPLQAQQPAQNKQLVITMNNLFNEGKATEAMSYFSDSLRKLGNINGKSALQAMHDDIQQTFPDVQTTIQDIWADGDWVIARCSFSGTHKGIARLPHHGGLLIGKEPTGKHFNVQHIRMYKIVNGKIVDRKAVRDDMLMYQQLGLIATPTPPGSR
jgi:predicted ester cyclase